MSSKHADANRPPQALADHALRDVTGGSLPSGDQIPLWLGDSLGMAEGMAAHDAAQFTAITDRMTQAMQDMDKKNLQDIG